MQCRSRSEGTVDSFLLQRLKRKLSRYGLGIWWAIGQLGKTVGIGCCLLCGWKAGISRAVRTCHSKTKQKNKIKQNKTKNNTTKRNNKTKTITIQPNMIRVACSNVQSVCTAEGTHWERQVHLPKSTICCIGTPHSTPKRDYLAHCSTTHFGRSPPPPSECGIFRGVSARPTSKRERNPFAGSVKGAFAVRVGFGVVFCFAAIIFRTRARQQKTFVCAAPFSVELSPCIDPFPLKEDTIQKIRISSFCFYSIAIFHSITNHPLYCPPPALGLPSSNALHGSEEIFRVALSSQSAVPFHLLKELSTLTP